MEADYYIERIGIVDGLDAKRKKERVVHLALKVRFDTDIEGESTWNDDLAKDIVHMTLPPGVDVNPGDLVHMSLRFTNPLGQRFRPALEASADEGDFQTDENGELVDEG